MRKPSPYQRQVAEEFRKLLREKPKLTKTERIKQFDKIADEVKGR